MAYIGQTPVTTFESSTAVQRFNGDGSDTTFTLTTAVSSVQDVLVSVDGVVQDTSAYSIPDGTTLTFTAAPSSGTANIFVNYLAPQTGSVTPPEEFRGSFRHGGLFKLNAQSVTTSTTILATENAVSTGPITIASGVTVTINSGGRYVVV